MIRHVTAALLVSAIFSLPAAAKNLNYAHGYPADSAVGKAAVTFAEQVEKKSDSALSVKPFAMSLLSLSETGPGLRDGMADIGYVLTPYYSAEYATSLLLHEMNLLVNLGQDKGIESFAYAGAIADYTLNSCPECQTEFAAQNQVYTGTGVTSLYGLQCKSPVAKIEDLAGKRVRTAGAGFVRFAEHFKAVAVPLPINEVYEALSQGVIDCAMLSAPELINYNMFDVVTDVTLNVPGGLFAGVAGTNVNRSVWQALSTEERAALIWGASHMAAAMTWNFVEQEAEAIRMAEEKGIRIHTPDEAMLAPVRAFVENDLKTMVDVFKSTYRVERTAEIAAEFPAVLERWRGLVKGVGSYEDLQKIYWDELYSKIDPATYGL